MNTTKRNWPELLLGLGIIAVGLVMAWQANVMKVIQLYAKVGPAAFLWFSAALLISCGAVVAWKSQSTAAETQAELKGPLLILAGLGVSVFIMDAIGFIATAIVIFVFTARGLGSRSLLRDVIIAAILSVAAYVVFAKLLGLRLPLGYLFT